MGAREIPNVCDKVYGRSNKNISLLENSQVDNYVRNFLKKGRNDVAREQYGPADHVSRCVCNIFP